MNETRIPVCRLNAGGLPFALVVALALLVSGCVPSYRLIGAESFNSGDDRVALVAVTEHYHLDGLPESLIDDCGMDASDTSSVGPLTPWLSALLVKPLIGMFVGQVERSIARRIEEYSSTYSAATELAFYQTMDNRSAQCFRFMRDDSDGGEAVHNQSNSGGSDSPHDLDLVFRLKTTPEEDHLELETLYLRLDAGKPKSKDDNFSLAARLDVTTTWRQQNRGVQEQVISSRLYSGNLAESSRASLSGGTMRVPIIPFSTNADAQPKHSWSRFTVSVAEVGTVPKGLLAMQAVFTRATGDVSELLATAAAERLDDSEDSDDS